MTDFLIVVLVCWRRDEPWLLAFFYFLFVFLCVGCWFVKMKTP